jgi:predicted enzyme related to lactoylglutathione lyase
MTASVNHFEIPADDMARAKSFYANVFGWSMEDWDAENAMINPTGEDGIGGDIHQRSEVPHPTVVVSVDDVEASMKTVLEQGGEAIGGVELLGDMGRYCYFRDTEGNVIGLFDKVGASS